jgi:response regulator RpfG family c-di-GMP phosphodiesterase
MMNVGAAAGRLPLILLVDPVVASRHSLWRVLHRGFGVLEADSAASARTWMLRRPDIDAIVVHDDLPDERGIELAQELVTSHPSVKRAYVLASAAAVDSAAPLHSGLTHLPPGDLHGVVKRLVSWLSMRDAGLARSLLRDAERLSA